MNPIKLALNLIFLLFLNGQIPLLASEKQQEIREGGGEKGSEGDENYDNIENRATPPLIPQEEEELYSSPPSSPSRMTARQFLQITPEKAKKQREKPSSPSKEPTPLSLSDIKLILTYHKKNYLYPLLNYSFCDSYASLKMKLNELIYEKGTLSEFLFNTYDAIGHWSLLWAYKSAKTENILTIIYLDSIGFEGSYKRHLFENVIGHLWEKNQSFKILMPAPKRQNDKFNCALFAINDLRALSWFYYEKLEKEHHGEDNYNKLYELFKGIPSESYHDIDPNFYRLTNFPDILMQGTQSVSTIRKHKVDLPEDHPKSPVPYCNDTDGKSVNQFIAYQREQIDIILDLERQAMEAIKEEEEGLDASW